MNSTHEILYQEGEIRIELTTDQAAGLVVKFSGVIDHLNPGEFLDPLLLQIHEAAPRQQAPLVAADLSGLSFLNSSGIKSFVKWIMTQLKLEAAQRYRIEFHYSPAVTWQQSTLKALVVLSRNTITLQEV